MSHAIVFVNYQIQDPLEFRIGRERILYRKAWAFVFENGEIFLYRYEPWKSLKYTDDQKKRMNQSELSQWLKFGQKEEVD